MSGRIEETMDEQDKNHLNSKIRDRSFLVDQWAQNARNHVRKMENLNRFLFLVILVNILTFTTSFYNVHWGSQEELNLYARNHFTFLGVEAPLVLMCFLSLVLPVALFFSYMRRASGFRRSVFEIVKLGSKMDAFPVCCQMPLWRILFNEKDQPSIAGKYFLVVLYLLPSLFSFLILLLLYHYGPLYKLIIVILLSVPVVLFELYLFLKWMHIIIIHKSHALMEADENYFVAFEGIADEGPFKGQYIKIYRRHDAKEEDIPDDQLKIKWIG